MAYKKRSKAIAGLILLLMVLFGLGMGFGLFDNLKAITGTNTLSLTQAILQSDNPHLNGKVWLMTFSSGGLGQKYYGSFSPSNVQSATSDSSTTTKDFSIDVTYSDQTCNYAITGTSSNKPIYDITSITWTYVPFVNPCSPEEATKRGLSTVLKVIKPTLSTTCYGIGYNSQNPVGNLNSPDLQSQFTINLQAGDKSVSKTIDTLSESTQGPIGDFGYVSWIGSLVSGQSCPSKSPYRSAYVNGNWRIISSDAYTNYLSQLSSTPPSSKDFLEVWINNLKNSASQAKLSKSFGSINSQTSLNNALVKITLQNQIQFPVTTLYIKADAIGIYTPTPEIKLLNAASSCFQTGEQGGISLTLQNIGNERGVWNVYAKCQDPFISNSNLQVGLNAGETITKVIPITASASSEKKAECTIYAESPAGIKQLSADVCVKPQITCTPNQKFCAISGSSEVVKQCSSDGAIASIINTCGVGETCENAECVLSESGGDGFGLGIIGKIKDFFKNIMEFTVGSIKLVRILSSVLAGLSAFLFGFDLFKKFEATRKKGIALTLSLIIASAIGYIAYVSFWIGVIVLGVWILFKLLVGGQLLALKKGVKALRR